MTSPAGPDCRCGIEHCDHPEPAQCAVHGELHALVCTALDWPARLAQIVAEATARRDRARALRAELKVARDAGKAARHAARLRSRGGT